MIMKFALVPPVIFLLFLGSAVGVADSSPTLNDAGDSESPVMLYQCASADDFKFVEYIIVTSGTVLFEIDGKNTHSHRYVMSSGGEFHFHKGKAVPDAFGQSPQTQDAQFEIAKAIVNNGKFSLVYRDALDATLAATPSEKCPPSIENMVPGESHEH